MSEFFKGWRRTVGCISLAMALAIVAIWVYSRTARPEMSWRGRADKLYSISLTRSGVRLRKTYLLAESKGPENTGGGHLWNFVVPYWHAILPLSLISAYLLLIKPQGDNVTSPDQSEPSIRA